ncbi:MAG: alpha/beta fold hydrolase [Erythrobacter sp.]|nr:alpha/beta fold hydrolase [Erythrobacter sp.]
MSERAMPGTAALVRTQPAMISCPDGAELRGVFHSADHATPLTVIVNPATGVPARWYGPFASYLATKGFGVLRYDYRGVATSRSAASRSTRWYHWGQQDFEGALGWVRRHRPGSKVCIVGHSFGGFLPGLAHSAGDVVRILTVGAQYAHWADYPPGSRAKLILKWHLVMRLLSKACGRFPGRRLGWGEDLPSGVAGDWARGLERFEDHFPQSQREHIRECFAAVDADILAIGFTDDPMASPRAIRRALEYYTSANCSVITLDPVGLGSPSIGHLGFFDERKGRVLWPSAAQWLRGQTDGSIFQTSSPKPPDETVEEDRSNSQ